MAGYKPEGCLTAKRQVFLYHLPPLTMFKLPLRLRQVAPHIRYGSERILQARGKGSRERESTIQVEKSRSDSRQKVTVVLTQEQLLGRIPLWLIKNFAPSYILERAS